MPFDFNIGQRTYLDYSPLVVARCNAEPYTTYHMNMAKDSSDSLENVVVVNLENLPKAPKLLEAVKFAIQEDIAMSWTRIPQRMKVIHIWAVWGSREFGSTKLTVENAWKVLQTIAQKRVTGAYLEFELDFVV